MTGATILIADIPLSVSHSFTVARCTGSRGGRWKYRSVAACARRSVTPAVIRRAQIRTALHHFSRNQNFRCPRINTRLAPGTARIVKRAARSLDELVVLIPVRRPFPHIAGHFVEAIAVGRESTDWRRPLVPVFQKVLPGELTLPCIRHWLAIRHVFVAPDELGCGEARLSQCSLSQKSRGRALIHCDP